LIGGRPAENSLPQGAVKRRVEKTKMNRLRTLAASFADLPHFVMFTHIFADGYPNGF
jgi:hypothetical protein